MVKTKIDYNETDKLPELVFNYNTASQELEEKIFRRFAEMAGDAENWKVQSASVANSDGTTKTTLKIVAV